MTTFGLGLLVLAAALAAVEAHVSAYGVLGALALAALAGGLGLTVAGAGAQAAVAIGVAIVAALAGGVALFVVLRQAFAVRRLPPRHGAAGLVGAVGEVRTAPEPVGCVAVDGALWRARSWDLEEDVALRPGDPIVVEGVAGLTLTVRRAEEWELVR
jgi:membrane-bound serine protease (ClpP class)